MQHRFRHGIDAPARSLQKATCAALLLATSSFLACTSSNESDQHTNGASETAQQTEPSYAPGAPNKKVSGEPAAPRDENEMNRREIARLQADLQTMREQMKSLERSVEILMRGERSGIFAPDMPTAAQPLATPPTPTVTNKSGTETGERTVSTTIEQQGEPVQDEMGNSPVKRLADVEQKMRIGKFNEAAVILNDIQRTMPNLRDGGSSLLLLATCYNKTRQFDAALTTLQTFYLRFPDSAETQHARLLEGEAQEGTGAKERALRVYRDIIATGPHSPYAETARSSMQRLRDAK
jgi:TolA-binding protein